MNYRKNGENFCYEINNLLKSNQLQAAFVTGGGYAYDSIKYNSNNQNGDYDFMIIYENDNDVQLILNLLSKTNFNFEKKYLELDQQLLKQKKIDIIRLSGNYQGIKSTINLVPKKIIKKICNFEKEFIIKKIAHNRNTSLFFSYGSDNSRIIVNFVSPSFVTKDKEDHYIHLDFSFLEKNKNIYLGILADAILKGFNNNYDAIGFKQLRLKFIENIHNYFKQNNIDSKNFLNLFANNRYFPQYLKEKLLSEFNKLGEIKGKQENSKELNPIILSTNFDINYKTDAFNFINNKPYKMNFTNYIKKMQNTEYDRQYLIDALGKFFGYLLFTKHDNKKYISDNIFNEMQIYGTNDIYLPNANNFDFISIVESIVIELTKNSENYNNELIKNFLMICSTFLSMVKKENIETVMDDLKINQTIFNRKIENTKMDIEIIKKLNSFDQIGIYHNYVSKVMPNYTKQEIEFLTKIFKNKNASIIDIMCGYGRITNQLKNQGYSNITGIDKNDYNFLGVPKDFIFIKDNFYTYYFNQKYDYAYSLYNCYSDINNLYDFIQKVYRILNIDGIFIIDCFNKKWRDNIESNFYKELYIDQDYKLVIRRSYNELLSNELTIYTLYYKNKIINEFEFNQRFFDLEEIIDIINTNNWDFKLMNSEYLKTRNNTQKHIMILRRK